jgi:RNA ligase (TIGR02306 family)
VSTFSCPIVQIPGFGKHKNADTLNITQIEGSVCIFKDGAFQKGDLALFVPIEAMVPFGHPAFDWLRDPKKPNQTHYRVKARRLRGVFSDGFLTPLHDVLPVGAEIITGDCETEINLPDGTSMKLGSDMGPLLGITKAVDQLPPQMGGDAEYGPDDVPVYDIEPWKKYKGVFDNTDEKVIITEKLHGTNSRFVYKDGRLWVGSRNRFLRDEERNLWWNVAREHGLETKLKNNPGLVVFGEVYGVQDLKYDCEPGKFKFAVFDMYHVFERRYLNWAEMWAACMELELPVVPVLYQGPIGDGSVVETYTNPLTPEESFPEANYGPYKSMLGTCIREGVVVKPAVERWNYHTHRTILKHVSQAYLLRKGGTEAQ